MQCELSLTGTEHPDVSGMAGHTLGQRQRQIVQWQQQIVQVHQGNFTIDLEARS